MPLYLSLSKGVRLYPLVRYPFIRYKNNSSSSKLSKSAFKEIFSGRLLSSFLVNSFINGELYCKISIISELNNPSDSSLCLSSSASVKLFETENLM